MRRIGVAAVLAVGLVGCVQPVPAPEPERLTVALTPADVVTRAAAALTAEGFEVVTSDAQAGVLTARRVRLSTGNATWLRCAWSESSVGYQTMRSTFTVSVSAQPAEGGSAVTVRTQHMADYPDSPMPSSDTTCASNGSIEQRVVAALGGPTVGQ